MGRGGDAINAVGKGSEPTATATPAPDPGFAEIRGGRWHLPSPGKGAPPATVLLFVARECPISNAYSPEINKLVEDFGPRGVSFCLVYTEPDLDAASAAKHAADYGYRCPGILDPDLKLASRTGVTVTPEAAVLAADGTLAYRGRIDDRYPSLGKRRDQPTRRDLREALTELLAGRPVSTPRTSSVGCYIERRKADICVPAGSCSRNIQDGSRYGSMSPAVFGRQSGSRTFR